MTVGRRIQFCRVGLGLLTLILFHLLSDIPLAGLVREWQDHESHGTIDDITAYESRFAAVRAELPVRGVAGYRTQLLKKGAEDVFAYRSGRGLAEMPLRESCMLAQYAVAPVIVDLRERHPFTIANLRDEVRLVRSEGQ